MPWNVGTPLSKRPLINRLGSASTSPWSFLHLLPRQGPVKPTKVSNLLGQDLLPVPFHTMKYVDSSLCGLVADSSRVQWNVYTA